ncbi:MAG TPA: 3-deoxy-manno-octulosonate cytidylyltransferase [bacterium]|nr:3-deoxy-manno-octulosonate cytidylyltransferase [bacterium]HPN29440.1 3-deoxy-manno-octulosonate cytidylyltransferase [bacterium]
MVKDKHSKKKLKILAVLPARYGSTRLPGKPLIRINGKSIIQYVFENVSKSKLIDKIIVATDDARIYEESEKFGCGAVMTPADCKSGGDRIAYAVKNCGLDGYDIIANVQGDEPLLKSEDVDAAIIRLIENDSDISTLAIKFKKEEDVKNPNYVKVVFDNKFNALYFSRSVMPYPRDSVIKPEIYYKHIGLYVYRKKTLLEFETLPESILENYEKLEQLRFLENGYGISAAITGNETIGIDTPEDIIKFEKTLTSK